VTLVDTHCHLDFGRFDADRADVVARAAAAGVTRIIIPALDLDNCAAILRLAQAYPGVYAAVGVHPNSTADWEDGWLTRLRALAAHPKVVAIGEIGLDYYWKESPPATQQRAFAAQLALAADLGLPVIVHNREASADVIPLLAQSPLAGRERAGVLHSFSADAATARAALDLNFYLGFTGPLTYKSAESLRTIAAAVPLDRLLVETDAPFLAPQAWRGQRNEPAYVVAVADRLAALHRLTSAEMATHTTRNAERLFNLPPFSLPPETAP
jgi:TatD DNase family protein